MSSSHVNRREFLGLTAAGLAGGVLSFDPSSSAGAGGADWDARRPPVRTGKALVVQPLLMYRVAEKRPATSWKSWGGVQTDAAANTEAQTITEELSTLAARADVPLEILPIVKVKSAAEAARVQEKPYDAVLVYAASGSGDLLKTCFTPHKDRDTLIFVRHRSGTAYYWYEALSTRYLQTGRPEPGRNSHLDHGPVHVEDVVVDDYDELLWRLRGLYGLKNFLGTRIVALGGPWGKYAPEAPQVAREKYRFHIIDVPYDDIAPRIKAAREDRDRMAAARRWAEAYLALPGTTLATTKDFVTNAFVLYGLFRDLLGEHEASAFTIRNCMSTIMPMAQTTPCLTLGLLNDEGLMAFCESDFVIIPAGVLLHHICGTPVFLHNSTFPHDGLVTCAHCSSPRRLNGRRYEPATIVTHFESEYGAAPKVEMRLGQRVTFVDPEYSTGRWLGFTGVVKSNPAYEICRSQQDVEIRGDWKKLINEVRDSHWMMAYGDHLKELAYAARKLGIQWFDLSGS
ncbi:MAG: sugar isomerase [Planctomycetes bacterium]|jgi:L-fucose isomerase-like protein|nr:sugar isomerase [Planctomycetota bacterium]